MPPVIQRLSACAEVKNNPLAPGKVPAHSIDVFAARTVYASSIPGITIGCDLDTGHDHTGSAVTLAVGRANAVLINAVLATATAIAPVHLVLDSGIAVAKPSGSVGGAVLIPATGNVTITGMGWRTGIYIVSGSNSHAITNTAGTDASSNSTWNPGIGATALVGKNVTLRDFRINCNRGTYPNGNCNGGVDGTNGAAVSPDARGSQTNQWLLNGIFLNALENVELDKLWVYDGPTFHINVYACLKFWAHHCRIEAATPSFSGNTDGFHFNGGCQDCRVTDCWISTGDDCVAFNMDEGNGQDGADLVMADCVSVGCQTVLRAYGKVTGALRRVEMRNVKATGIRYWAITLGDDGGSGASLAEATHSITVTDCDFQFATGSPQGPENAIMTVAGNAGSVEFCRVRMHEPTQAYAFVRMTPLVSTISRLVFDSCSIYRNTFGNAAAYLLDGAHGTIGDMVVSNFHYAEQSGQAFTDVSALINLAGTTVGNLTVSGKFKGVGSVVNVTSSSTVGAIDLPDVTHQANTGSNTAHTVVAAGSTIPVSVGRYRPLNLAGIASGTVALSGPGLAGQSIADGIAGNGWPYFSSTQSALSWKDGSGGVHVFAFVAATAFTVTGPTNGTTNVASSNFTITPNGVYTGTITATPSGGGLSTPVVKTFSGSSAPQTFTLTPTSGGAVTITFTNNGSLSNQSPLTYTTSTLVAGTAVVGSTTTTTASATAGEATGGTSPYTHQWFRSTTSSVLGSSVSGQTSTSLSDTGLTQNTTYYYTLRYTDSASNVVFSNQIAETTAATGLTTKLQDGFTGTPGSSIVGHVPDTTQNGSDVWAAAYSGDGAMVLGASGGVKSSGSGTNWSCHYPLTGVTNGQATYTIPWTTATGTGFLGAPTINLRSDGAGPGGNTVALQANYSNNTIELLVVSGGTLVTNLSVSFSFTTGVTYTAVITLGATTFSATLNGTPVFTGQTIAAGSDTNVYLRQQVGAAGDVTFNSVEVQV